MLDGNWDSVYGSGVDDFLFDQDAVAQIVQSRLRLWKGEWWENLKEGLPMFQKILGTPGTNRLIIDRLIQDRVEKTPYVTGIVYYESAIDPDSREFNCTMTINTQFGETTHTFGGG